VNNTVVQAADARWALNIQNGSTGNRVYNNILYSYHATRGAISISANSLAGFESDYNAVIGRFTTDGGSSVMSLSAWRSATGQDVHSFTSTPAKLFVDSVNHDHHLKLGSPAVDRGTTVLAAKTDLEGRARPAWAGLDVGAYELV
jgi:hypothetical protein